MNVTLVIAIIAGWLICAVLATGISFADLQGRFTTIAAAEKRRDLGLSVLLGLGGGPVALLVTFCHSGFCKFGWRLW